MPANLVLAFDAYGTLLSTESMAKQLASHFGDEKAATIAAEWRKYQLEYTWRLNSMNKYTPFSTVTHNALRHTLSEHSLSLPSASQTSLLESYNTLSLFPDAPALFPALQSHPQLTATIFTNGNAAMLDATLRDSADLAPHAHLFKEVVTVDDVQRFKPHPDVYAHFVRRMGMQGREAEVWLVTGNPFDVVGARACGWRTCWVDRAGLGWCDGLVQGEEGAPTVVVRGLGEVVERIVGWVEREGK